MKFLAILGALIFGLIFAYFAFLRVETINSFPIRTITAFFLFGFYCAIVLFGTSDKKRTLPLSVQTLLGIFLSLSIAALFNAPPEGYVLAALLGIGLGFTADKWAEYIQLP